MSLLKFPILTFFRNFSISIPPFPCPCCLCVYSNFLNCRYLLPLKKCVMKFSKKVAGWLDTFVIPVICIPFFHVLSMAVYIFITWNSVPVSGRVSVWPHFQFLVVFWKHTIVQLFSFLLSSNDFIPHSFHLWNFAIHWWIFLLFLVGPNYYHMPNLYSKFFLLFFNT